MKKYLFAMVAVFTCVLSLQAAPWMEVNGVAADYATFHYYIDESEGQTDQVFIDFWPNEGNLAEVEIFSNLNQRDLATLSPAGPDAVVAGDSSQYFMAHTMNDMGSGHYQLTLPIEKCGAYRITCRYRLNGDPTWRWFGQRDAAVVVSDTKAREMIIYELQVNVVDATGDGYLGRSTFADLHDGNRFDLSYINQLGANTLWLMPFHPIGSKADGNHGDPGSPYSIKNMWKVGEHLGKDGTREGAMNEFKDFMAAAEAANVNIMFDTIFNHTAKDAEVERNPDDPTQLAADPLAQIRFNKPNWYSKYTGDGSCFWTSDAGGSPPYEYWSPADNSNQLGPAPADRHDFGKWCDTSDLFWGTYSALGNPQNEDDGIWNTSEEVKKMTEYYAYFAEYWLNESGGAIDGFRCDFAQGLPSQAWEYFVNKAKSLKPELVFMAESLDGGAVSRRAGRHFDIINENWVWAVLGNTENTSGYRGIIDARKQDYGFAGILRGLINHDQNAPGDKWWTMSRYAVGCAIDGAPQMFMGQELGYSDGYGFSTFRFEFDRYVPNIREFHNMNTLWSDTAWDHDALWHRYAEVNKARQASSALIEANQYYLDQKNGGTHEQIFSVLKYTKNGWDVADQDVVVCLVNLQPGVSHAGNFNVDIPVIFLDPNKSYNVRDLASGNPSAYLWPQARSGSDIAANGIYASFSANLFDDNSVAQFLKLEEEGSVGGGDLWVGNTSNFPGTGELNPGENLWIDTEVWPIAIGQNVTVSYRVNGGAWIDEAVAWNYNDDTNSHWNKNLGSFALGDVVEYFVQVANGSETAIDNANTANYSVTVVNGPCGDELLWAGNGYNWPANGEVTAADDLWVNIESYPIGAAAIAEVVYSDDDGATWTLVPMSVNGTIGANDQWHANLGQFPAGTEVQYAISVEDCWGNTIWDNNGGGNFTVNIGSGLVVLPAHFVSLDPTMGTAVTKLESWSHDFNNDFPDMNAGEVLMLKTRAVEIMDSVMVQQGPVELGVELTYTTVPGDWSSAVTLSGTFIPGTPGAPATYDYFSFELGPFTPGTQVEFWMKAENSEGVDFAQAAGNDFSFSVVGVEDSDDDGLLDTWEMDWFGDLTQDADGNDDGDGPTGRPMANMVEMVNKTSPDVPNDHTGVKLIWSPAYPVAGGQVTLSYFYVNEGNPLFGKPVYGHVGHNGWVGTQTSDQLAVNGAVSRLEVTVDVPVGATVLDIVFNDQAGTWDNNGEKDWHIPVKQP